MRKQTAESYVRGISSQRQRVETDSHRRIEKGRMCLPFFLNLTSGEPLAVLL